MIEILKQYWLSEREANVYITWLTLWSVPSSTIARHMEENRVTIYSILKELIKKWVFSCIIRNKVKYFSPVSPELLLKNLEHTYMSFKENMPQLLNIISNESNIPKLNYYEGREGIKNLYNETLKFKFPIYAFLSDSQIDPILEDYLNTKFINMRRNLKIHASVIVAPWEETENYIHAIWTKDPLTSIKIAPPSLSGLQGETILFWERYIACALYGKKEMIWFLVESTQLYKSLYTLFNFVWSVTSWKGDIND